MKLFKYAAFTLLFLLISACATIKKQIAENQPKVIKKDSSKIEHTFYLIGDAGNSTLEEDSPALKYLKKQEYLNFGNYSCFLILQNCIFYINFKSFL